MSLSPKVKWNSDLGINEILIRRVGNFFISNCAYINWSPFSSICLKYSSFREYFVFSYFSYTNIQPVGMSVSVGCLYTRIII